MTDELILPEPIGPQVGWLEAPQSRKVFRVGRRGMKTRTAFIAAMSGHGPGWRDRKPLLPGVLQGGDVVWIAQNYTNLTTVLWREEVVPRMGHLPWVSLNTQRHDVEIPGLGALMLRSGDREAIDSIRGIGKRLNGVIIDEAAWLDLRGALQDVILLALADNGGWLIIMSTTNAGSDGGYDDTGAPQVPSYFNVLCADIEAGRRGPEWVVFRGTAFDNPSLSPKAIEELIAEYPPDSPKLKQEVYAELLTTGVGLALPGLSETIHVVEPFEPDTLWQKWSAFDWGFHHPWTFGDYTSDGDGHVYKAASLTGRMDLPEAIDAKVRQSGINPALRLVYAGPDIWQTRVKQGTARGPTIAEALQALGWRLVPADNARVLGLNNIRRYVQYDPAKPHVAPRFQWMRNEGNLTCLRQMGRIPLDPKNPEDALKVDADHAGRGGDDFYDETRYGLMARPIAVVRAPSGPKIKRDDEAVHWDFKNKKPLERTAEEAFAEMGGFAQGTKAPELRPEPPPHW